MNDDQNSTAYRLRNFLVAPRFGRLEFYGIVALAAILHHFGWWAIEAVIGMVKSTNHRFHVVTIFRKLECQE
jgi:hypothetical protein